jgi:tetratricopeptide (TPR) repeat protein
MQATGAGPRVLARALTPVEVRRALFCGVCCASISLAGCETLSTHTVNANLPAAEIAGLALSADQAYRNEDWPAAAEGYRRMTELAPDEAEHWFRLGNSYAHMNKIGDAVRMYGEALQRNEGHLGAWHNLGMAQLQLAARSFAQLQTRAPADDPARDRARRLIDGITGVLESEQSEMLDSQP